eukprot:gene9404-19512_t
MKQLHALHWMGYKLEMLRDIQIIREIVALAYIVEATKRQQSKGCRMIIHWTHSPEMTNLEIKFRERLYWSIHNQEMHVEQYAVVGMTSVVQITNLRHQGAYTNAEDDEKGAEQSEDEVGADQAPDDEGRESEDGKEHTPAQDLADTMAATHILNANRNMGKSYRVATTEGAAWSTIGPKGKSVRLEPLDLARQGGGTVLGKEGEGRSGYTRGEEGRGGRGRMISSPQQHAQMGTAEDRTNAQMDTDTRRRRAQLQEEVAELMQYYTGFQHTQGYIHIRIVKRYIVMKEDVYDDVNVYDKEVYDNENGFDKELYDDVTGGDKDVYDADVYVCDKELYDDDVNICDKDVYDEMKDDAVVNEASDIDESQQKKGEGVRRQEGGSLRISVTTNEESSFSLHTSVCRYLANEAAQSDTTEKNGSAGEQEELSGADQSMSTVGSEQLPTIKVHGTRGRTRVAPDEPVRSLVQTRTLRTQDARIPAQPTRMQSNMHDFLQPITDSMSNAAYLGILEHVELHAK